MKNINLQIEFELNEFVFGFSVPYIGDVILIMKRENEFYNSC